MGAGPRGEDYKWYYERYYFNTRSIALGTTGAQNADIDRPVPGRYLIQIHGMTSGETAWIKFAPHADGEDVATSMTAGVPNFPVTDETFLSFEVNIRKGLNDRIAAVLSSGSAILFYTRISAQ